MPSFNPFTSVTGRNSFTLFEVRLENDFIVFRGSEHESSGQLLRGTVVLCLPAALRVEDVHLRLIGTLRLSWTDSRMTSTSTSSQRVDKSSNILSHKWPPFAGIGASDPSAASLGTRSVTLPAGNYEWPFEFMLPGDTTESIEGIPEASITYKLKATVARGKLAYDLHTYKRLRIIRTLDPSALEYLHAMSVENIWPNKIEYSIVVPQKAVVFGTAIPLETRFTPLLKGLDLGDLTAKLVEVHDVILQPVGHHIYNLKEHKKEREVETWIVPLSKDEHWHDVIDESGQEGWVMNTHLDLPGKLGKCMQDVNAQGIRIRHKLKLVVALKNPDGHISELRATLPVTIFISPNMPLDEDGNLVHQLPHGAATSETDTGGAPPGYGQHVLDQLYDDVDLTGLQTPGLQTPGFQSGVNSPSLALSRAGSSENLAAMANRGAILPAALVSRLQSVPLDASRRNHSWNSLNGLAASPQHPCHAPLHTRAISDGHHSAPQSNPLTRQNSDESGATTPEHVDHAPDMEELSKVPSYGTAVRTPVRPLGMGEAFVLPNYQTAVANSAPASPGVATDGIGSPLDALAPIVETPSAGTETELTAGPGGPMSVPASREPSPNGRSSRSGWRRQSLGFSLPTLHHLHYPSHHNHHHHHGHQNGHADDERRRVMSPQVRERVV